MRSDRRSWWAMVCGVCAVCAVWVVGNAAAQDCAVLYEHGDYGGASLKVSANASVGWIGDQWNDQVSSVKVRKGCSLVVYEHANFEGAYQAHGSDTAWVGDAWNDQISGYTCACTAPAKAEACATVYEHARYEGRSRKVKEGEQVSWVGDDWNDQISSVKVRPGCTLTAAEHANYEGSYVTYSADTDWVGEWNDHISAYWCACGQ